MQFLWLLPSWNSGKELQGGNKLQVKASHMSSTHGVRRIKEKSSVTSREATETLGLRETLGHGEVGSRFPELVDTIEKFGKECCEVLCVLSILAKYVAV